MALRLGWKARYSVLSVLFLSFFVCYLDRMVISTSIPFIAKDLNLSKIQMGAVMSAFFISYALMQFPAGLLADKFGPRMTMLIGVAWWTLFTVLTGAATSFLVLIVIRVTFGLGEGLFPTAASKTLSIWFPSRERGVANSVMITSNLLAPAIAPLFVVAMLDWWNWRMVFYSLIIPGCVILPLIWFFVKNAPAQSTRIKKEELDEILEKDAVVTGSAEKRPKVLDIVKNPIVWKCFIIILFSNMTTWGLMSWLPTYLLDVKGFSTAKMGIAISIPFVAAIFGTFTGGMLSDKLFSNKRKWIVMTGYVTGALILFLTLWISSDNLYIFVVTVAFFAVSMATSAFWTIPLTQLKTSIIGSSMGIINSGAQLAGFIAPLLIGYMVTISGGSYNSAFIILAVALLAAALAASTIQERSRVLEGGNHAIMGTGE